MEKTTLQVTREGFELDDIILAGVQHHYTDQAERFRALIGIAAYLHKHHIYEASDEILHFIIRNKTQCLEVGVCPGCGKDVTVGEGQVYVCSGDCGTF